MKQYVAPSLTLVIGIGILLVIPQEVPAAEGEGIGSRTLPYILSGVLAGAGLLELIRIAYNHYRIASVTRQSELTTDAALTEKISLRDWGAQGVIIGITLFWAYSLEHLGHFVVSTLLSVLVTLTFGLRRPVVMVFYTTVLIVVTYYLFAVILAVRLPGIGGVFN